MEGAPTGAVQERPRWLLPALLGAIGVLIAMNTAGGLLLPTLVERHPAVLIALNATNRSLIGATNNLSAPAFFGIGFLRLSVADPLFFVLGTLYGDAAIRWIERKAGDGAASFLWFEKLFKKARYPMVLVAPNNIICLLAGATAMRIPTFLALNVTGTVARLLLIRRLGAELEEPIRAVTGFLDRYRLPLIGASVALFALQAALRKKPPGGIQELREIEREALGVGPVDVADVRDLGEEAAATGPTGPAEREDLDRGAG